MIGPVAKSLIKLNAWLTFLLVVVCIIGIHNTRTRLDDLSRRAQKNDALRIAASVLTNPDFATYSAAQKDALVQEIVVAIAKDLKPLFLNVTATFFLGNSDGTLPAFFDNIFAYTFQEMGANVEKNAGIIATTMRKYKSSCSTTRECLIQGTIECPNGGSAWCSAPGEFVKCDSCSSWIDPIITGAAITNSVAYLLSSRWKDIPNPSSSTPAFSAGVFRLDELFTWAQNQVQVGSWQIAGRTCSGFIQSVESVAWIGTYVDTNGNPQTWDARSQVHSVTEVAAKVCSALSQL